MKEELLILNVVKPGGNLLFQHVFRASDQPVCLGKIVVNPTVHDGRGSVITLGNSWIGDMAFSVTETKGKKNDNDTN